MEALVTVALLALAIHQFWTGHKKDKAGNVKAGRGHMLFSIVLIVAGIILLNAIS